MTSLEAKYIIPKETFKTTYSGLLKGLLQIYIKSYKQVSPIIKSTENINAQNVVDSLPNEAKKILETIPEEVKNNIKSYSDNFKNMDINSAIVKAYINMLESSV